ncbi:MAG: phosphoadenylyl-sulfate reductase [Pseudomonadales bacterium]|nr:phosphoadenylyl-sulfate reductase [Pseudomonadales bacterium]
MLDQKEVEALNDALRDAEPKEILNKLLDRVPNTAISFSGAEDVLLIELCKTHASPPAIFTLDTGRLHPETYRFIERVRDHYNQPIEALFPDSTAVNNLVKYKGLYSFYNNGHEECCEIRKVQPLRTKLAGLDAWITGQRRDQSPTRVEVPVIEIDPTFSTDQHQVIKVNPLANWTSAQVWEYIRMFDVPYNELHDRGYVSIGCEPCTKAIGPNQHEREGRWWWEEATIKECGLHRGNIQENS